MKRALVFTIGCVLAGIPATQGVINGASGLGFALIAAVIGAQFAIERNKS